MSGRFLDELTPSAAAARLYRLADSLLACRSVTEIYAVAGELIARAVDARAAVLWRFAAAAGQLVPESVFSPDRPLEPRAVAVGTDFLGDVFRSGKARIISGIGALEVRHLGLSRDETVSRLACVPFKGRAGQEGVLELLGKGDASFVEEDIDLVSQCLDLMVRAAEAGKQHEDRERNQLHAITRLTLLYDISQVFNSTLELDELLPIIVDKIAELLDAGTCTIWLLDESGEALQCAYSVGALAEHFAELRPELESDILGQAVETDGGILLADATGSELLQSRLEGLQEGAPSTYMSTVLQSKDQIIGAVEIIDRKREEPFNEEDLFLLNDLAGQAATAIHNANLLDAERRAKELDALLEISRQLTSTLNLDRVLLTIVNESAKLIPYERAAIALQDRNSVKVAAVSGRMEVDQASPEIRDLRDVLAWVSGQGKGIYLSEFEGKIATDREENRKKFEAHFAKTGYKAFVAIPLKDEEGEVGIVCFESSVPYFLNERGLEIATILSNQATIAVRNAQLYRQVPLINLMEPIMQRKARLMRMPQSRKIAWGAAALLLVLLLLFVPWNMKVDGDATVLPAVRTPVLAEVDGIVRSVRFHEGDRVPSGAVIGQLEDREYRLALDERKTERDILSRQINGSESTGDSATSRMLKLRADQVDREIAFYTEQANRTDLVAPVAAMVITPRMEEKQGEYIRKGEQFCELANMTTPRAEIRIDESDIAYMKPGQHVRLKMNAYPTRKFYGAVTRIGSTVSPQGGSSGIYALRIEAGIDNTDQLLKSGMVGKARVEVGPHSIGYVLLRKPVRFVWKKFWTWLP